MVGLANHSRRLTALLPVPALVVLTAWLAAGDVRAAEQTAASATPQDAQRYLGQTPPGTAPEVFATGIVRTDAVELNGVFSPDFREFVFGRLIPVEGSQDGYVYPGGTRPVMFISTFADGAWTAPKPLLVYPDASPAMAVDMAFSTDGRELYFLGQFPNGQASLDIWVTRRVDGRWSEAERVSPPVSTEANEIYPVAVGSLYFISNCKGSLGDSDLWRAQRLPDGASPSPSIPARGEHVTYGLRVTR